MKFHESAVQYSIALSMSSLKYTILEMPHLTYKMILFSRTSNTESRLKKVHFLKTIKEVKNAIKCHSETSFSSTWAIQEIKYEDGS